MSKFLMTFISITSIFIIHLILKKDKNAKFNDVFKQDSFNFFMIQVIVIYLVLQFVLSTSTIDASLVALSGMGINISSTLLMISKLHDDEKKVLSLLLKLMLGLWFLGGISLLIAQFSKGIVL